MSNTKQNPKRKPGKKADQNTDLHDPVRDQEKLKNDEATLDLPDVKDIPGQEHIRVPHPGEYTDTTISSADEEGKDLWSDEDITDSSSNVSSIEKELLEKSANEMPTRDEQSLSQASLDATDNEGELLNEKTSSNAASGSDLDVPGAEQDDEDEEIGEEDEENNPYSLGGDDNSINEERSGV
jgi:hypothetical protein